MTQELKGVTWEALEHHHGVKSSDWLWALGILTIASSVTSILLGNALFGIVILISGAVVAILATREPQTIQYAVTQRGLRVDDKLYPYSTLECFYIDEEDQLGPQLLAKSEKMLMPLIVMPLPEEYMDDIENIIANRLPEIFLEEPFFNKLLEIFGF